MKLRLVELRFGTYESAFANMSLKGRPQNSSIQYTIVNSANNYEFGGGATHIKHLCTDHQ